MNAAVAAGIKPPTDFFKLTGEEQSWVVAWYEDNQQAKAVEALDNQQEQRAQAKLRQANRPLRRGE